MNDDLSKDGGYSSRKLHMSYVVMLLQTMAYAVCAKFPSLAALYPQFCMGLIGAAGVYIGGNTAIKWIAAKAAPSASGAPPADAGDTELSEDDQAVAAHAKNA